MSNSIVIALIYIDHVIVSRCANKVGWSRVIILIVTATLVAHVLLLSPPMWHCVYEISFEENDRRTKRDPWVFLCTYSLVC